MKHITSPVSLLVKIRCYPQVTIDDAGDGDGTLIVIAEDNTIDLNSGVEDTGTLIINGGTVKANVTLIDYAVTGNLIVNGGAVYLAGGDGARAVGGRIDGDATVYGWNENYGWISKEDWMSNPGLDLGQFVLNQYITTDKSSGYPTTDWNW